MTKRNCIGFKDIESIQNHSHIVYCLRNQIPFWCFIYKILTGEKKQDNKDYINIVLIDFNNWAFRPNPTSFLVLKQETKQRNSRLLFKKLPYLI
ncbi:hypothetical protein, partial [Labilibaculum euxinus]|uniref:hypothetical protein n=1 Tax=Labilibaculum euxinus TaxID=2686357 RepID=UPI001E2B3081